MILGFYVSIPPSYPPSPHTRPYSGVSDRCRARRHPGAPSFSAASIVQAADGTVGTLAPNTIATIYGTNLAFGTQTLEAANVSSGELPYSLAGVQVSVNGITAGLFYVSPEQINFLIPYEIDSTSGMIVVNRQGLTGPVVTVPLAIAAPAFFQWNSNLAVAEHADGTLITPSYPAQRGEIIVLFATGLGRTVPDLDPGSIVQSAAQILYLSSLNILLNGTPCPPQNILYAGVTPGFAGLYQINLRLPDALASNPLIQISIGAQKSPDSILLPVQ